MNGLNLTSWGKLTGRRRVLLNSSDQSSSFPPICRTVVVGTYLVLSNLNPSVFSRTFSRDVCRRTSAYWHAAGGDVCTYHTAVFYVLVSIVFCLTLWHTTRHLCSAWSRECCLTALNQKRRSHTYTYFFFFFLLDLKVSPYHKS